ncbi:MAG: hydroxymethylglutaryl-CoA lyase [Bacteroidetes bacterium]|jgi:hydroxymethylglutaryl-CoA lyase|nr:hydroxymethylglutaryl-CoA lyase [Bacteroidota bacterium]
MHAVHLVECPRDAIQGWPHLISTDDKIAYYRSLLDVGFNTLDLGSFVSHKAVPQMADTHKVIRSLQEEGKLEGASRTLVIVGNERGAIDACQFEGIDDIGFPFSISEQFQLRNTGSNIQGALERLSRIHEHVHRNGKALTVYLSMGFGNPYGDDWSPDLLVDWAGKIIEQYAPRVVALSDTIGKANSTTIAGSFSALIPAHPETSFGAHLHATPWDALEKIKAAHNAGCLRFDGALRGVGGCPMAQDELVGNIPTERMIEYFMESDLWSVLDHRAYAQAQSIAADLF